MTTKHKPDRFALYLFSALAVLAATLTGLLVHAGLSIQVTL
jgi:hypothetical protein